MAYLLNGGTLERAQAIAAQESPRTTKLHDRTSDEVPVEDIEKIPERGLYTGCRKFRPRWTHCVTVPLVARRDWG